MRSERRRHERKPLRASALLQLPDGAPLQVRTVDVSAGGLGVVSPVNINPRLPCMVRVNLPVNPSGQALLEAQATIAYCVLSGSESGFLIGLQFLNLPVASARAIALFLGG